jgi:hypothetical protein
MRNAPIRSAVLAASLALGLCAGLPASAQQQQDTAALTEKLFAAVRANDIATVRLTLTNGADPMAVDANGQTPAGVAIDRGYFDIAHHILGVRNQRQAMLNRDNIDDTNAPRAGARPASAAPIMGEERKPNVTWRDTTAPGAPAEIPAARLSSPQEATVITPSVVITGPTRAAQAQQKKAAEAAAAPPPAVGGILGTVPASAVRSAGAPATAPQTQQASLTNLPALPAGAPNPFDPKRAEPDALPVLTSTTPTVRPEIAADNKSRDPAGNAIGRFFNGITGIFGGGGS